MLGKYPKAIAAVSAAVAVGMTSNAFAQGFQQAEPIPSSIKQSQTAIDRSFTPPVAPELALFPGARSTFPETLPAFFRDSKIDFNLRSYYRDEVTSSPSSVGVKEAWAAGGSATVQTGRLFDLISGGAVFYTSQPVFAPPQYGNTGLLSPDQQGYTVVGQLYGQLHLPANITFTAGRYIYDTPFLGAQDNRMTPNTFYGYALQGGMENPDKGLSFRYGGGYIAAIKQRDSTNFVSMSRAAGADVDRGVGLAGGLIAWRSGSLGAVEYYAQDTINIAYGEGKHSAHLPLGIDALLALQFADQRSTGANLLTGSYFATDELGARLQMGLQTGILTAAYTVVAPGFAMQNPWSFSPFYTTAQIQSFQRAGENALLFGLSYDLTPLGIKDVAASIQYFNGWTSAPAAGSPLVENEWDLNLEWRPAWKPLQGLWLRARYGLSRTTQNGSTTEVNEIRLIANYKVKLY